MTPAFVATASAFALTPLWMTPFISVSGGTLPARGKLARRLAPFSETGLPVIPQLLGREAAPIAACAQRLAGMGFEFISLNCACPSGYVTSSGAGGALLKDSAKLVGIVESCLEALRGEASLIVKIRSGWDSPTAMETLLPALRSSGVELCVLHYRTVLEKYNIAQDALARLARAVELAGTMPLVGNGDIRGVADAEAMLAASGCAGVSFARGFLADPFLLRRVLGLQAPPFEEGRKLFLEALQAASEPSGFGNVLEVAKAMYGENAPEFRRFLT